MHDQILQKEFITSYILKATIRNENNTLGTLRLV